MDPIKVCPMRTVIRTVCKSGLTVVYPDFGHACARGRGLIASLPPPSRTGVDGALMAASALHPNNAAYLYSFFPLLDFGCQQT